MSEIGLFNYNVTPEELKETNERYEQAQQVLGSINPKMSDEELKDAFLFGKTLFKTRKNDKKIADLESMICLKAMTELMKRKISVAELVKKAEGLTPSLS